MRALFYTPLFLLLSFSLSAQTADHVAPFDSTYVFQIIKDQPEPVRAIFDWVAREMDYDLASLENLPTYSHPSELLDSIWMNRRGVCMHYAELMNAFCQKAGYESVVVNGYTVSPRTVDRRYGHSWNAVKVKGKWQLYDPTWAAGYRQGKRFVKKYDHRWYAVAPRNFIRTHVPFDPVWQLLEQPVNSQKVRVKTAPALAFADIIEQDKQLDVIAKDRAQLARIRAFADDNPLVLREVERIQNNIEIQIFKRGVANYNASIDMFNGFISNYNRGFGRSNWSDEKLQKMAQQINTRLQTAEVHFLDLDPENPIYRESLADNLQLMQTYKRRVKALNGFVYRYLKTWRIFRWLVRLEG